MKNTLLPSLSVVVSLLHAGGPRGDGWSQTWLNVGLTFTGVHWTWAGCSGKQKSPFLHEISSLMASCIKGNPDFYLKKITKVNNLNALSNVAINADLQHPSPDVQMKSALNLPVPLSVLQAPPSLLPLMADRQFHLATLPLTSSHSHLWLRQDSLISWVLRVSRAAAPLWTFSCMSLCCRSWADTPEWQRPGKDKASETSDQADLIGRGREHH